jgi:lipopolysaccharide export LptBFGC system permease protein LptF
MTLDKKEQVTIPQWALSLLVSILGAVFVFWGLWSGSKATLELRAEKNEANIETLRQEKVSKDEFKIVLDKLNSIENKLDGHIQR